MLRLKIILFFSLIILSGIKAQPFDVSVDTIFLNIHEVVRPGARIDLTHAVKFNDNYYCFFKEQGLYSFKINTRYFLIISGKGEIIKNIEVPDNIKNTVYFDFFIRDNSLLAKTYMDHKSYYLDLDALEWKEIKEVDDRVYEDEAFAIIYLDFGEWGQSTWFIDKQTKKEYVLGAEGTIVNKLDGKYYLTTGAEVREIENPLLLKQCKKDYYYRKVKREDAFYEGATSLTGSKVIYSDTTNSPWFSFEKPRQIIITSFVDSNKLYQLYSDKNSTHIGKIENGKLIPVQNIGKRYSIFNWYYSYRGKNLNNNSRFLMFREDNNTFGFIDIDEQHIEIQYLIHNQDSLKYLGTDGFEMLFNHIVKTSNNISLLQADSIENELGGIDMRDHRKGTSHNGFYPGIYASKDFETKSFIKVESQYIAQTIEY
ncbi:MAG: hypothetical protein RQ866_08120, partial [Bacteroidales bacterium]|nr:hypothetical protein [Bacteroidales bacterium]